MNSEMHGKKIAAVYWPDSETGKDRCLKAECGHALHLSVTYHGDRDEIWNVQAEGDTEIMRHNPRYVESIEWLQP